MIGPLRQLEHLRRRSGKHFLKSPQRFLPLLVFFSKKVKWVHLGVAKQSC